ncbi:MAG: response regulator [Deltaproteobacteria bacterium]|nr:response regulator [Deltaproteobacteria bacterium]MBW1923688.1 response regulator [Deltaproteobacteria bacterium]MBW1950763.1 response regulator [Deltaproteobacteria bacterium]MBW2348733.1 response regulator [Deltaproteobacteria bacterium]
MEKKPKILVVDDEEQNLRLMEALLVPLGYDVVVARNGEETFDRVAKTNPDVILLDILMPGLNGFEVAKKLKASEGTRIIPIVMVTSLNDVEDRVRALEAGADDFLAKPVEMTELRARVQSSLKIKAYYDHMRDYQKKLEAEVARRTAQLKAAFEKIRGASLETIYRLSRAAEYKDEDTGAHILRMSNYSSVVARKMGLNGRVVDSILYAAPMHDVGKIGTPDRILLKPGKLTMAECETMKQHAATGGKILEGADPGFMRLAEVVALTHHEKWDGSGYPNGLKGKKIPLAGRIVAIGDVFDALTSKRPYKEAFSLEKSYEIIRQSRGTHFDPDVVDAFFSAEDEIVAIKDRYPDEKESLFVRIAGRLPQP